MPDNDKPNSLPARKQRGTWVQTERAAHEAWAMFLGLPGSLNASRVLHLLIARVEEHNAVVMSQKTMAGLLGIDMRTVRRAVAMLKEHRWIETRQIGDRGTVNAYIINDRVAWSGPREGIRYSLFTANVVISDAEQPDNDALDHQEPLRRLPSYIRASNSSLQVMVCPRNRSLHSKEWSLTYRQRSKGTRHDVQILQCGAKQVHT